MGDKRSGSDRAELHRGLVGLAGEGRGSLFMVLQGWACGSFDAAWSGQRHRDRQPDRGPHRQRAGRSCRVRRQHACFAHRHVWRSELPRAHRSGSSWRPCRVYASGPCASSVWVRFWIPARSLSRHPAAPGDADAADAAPAGFDLPGLRIAAAPLRRRAPSSTCRWALRRLRAADGRPAGLEGELDTPPTCSIGETLRRCAIGWFVFWRRRSRGGAIDWQPVDLWAEERHTILRDWNATSHAVAFATVPVLFAAQAARTPVRWQLCMGTRSSPTHSLTSCRAGWRITCAVSGLGLR